MLVPKVICELCGCEISKSNYSKHLRRHQVHPETFSKSVGAYKLNHDGLICQFCGKECKTKNSLCNHERYCKNNPNKQESAFVKYNRERSCIWNKGLTKETDVRVAAQSESLKRTYTERPELRSLGGFKKSQTAKRCKWGTYKGFYCDSSWELAFVIYCLDNNLNIERNKEFFIYILDNKDYKFYPDFKIGDCYYEVKGTYFRGDHEKIEQFPTDKKLVVIDSSNIKPYLSYCKNKYGDFAKLYDRSCSSWMDVKEGDYNFKVQNNT